MSPESKFDLKTDIQRFLDGEIAIHQLEDLLVEPLWTGGDESDLAGSVHIAIAEFAEASLTEAALRRRLAEAIRPFQRSQLGPAEFRPMPSFLLYDLVPESAVELKSSNVRMRLRASAEPAEQFIPHQPPVVLPRIARAV